MIVVILTVLIAVFVLVVVVYMGTAGDDVADEPPARPTAKPAPVEPPRQRKPPRPAELRRRPNPPRPRPHAPAAVRIGWTGGPRTLDELERDGYEYIEGRNGEGKCRECGERIRWCRTPRRAWQPLTELPDGRFDLHFPRCPVRIAGDVAAVPPARPTAKPAPRLPRQCKPPRPAKVAGVRELLDSPAVVLDVETTGFGRDDEVLSVAVIDTVDNILLHRHSLPESRIPKLVSDMHGLTDARLRTLGAQRWPNVHATLEPILAAAHSVIAWNAPYDKRLVTQTSKRHSLAMPELPWMCAMKAAADGLGASTSKMKLSVAAQRLSVTRTEHHDALADAQTTLAVLRKLADRAAA